MTSNPEFQPIPSWLNTPPLVAVQPPVETREQLLPFDKLAWEDFERLCLRLARTHGTVEHCQLYGVRGQLQSGIDIYARSLNRDKYTVFQCKRVRNFGPSSVRTAVTEFLGGSWREKTEQFVLCTSESMTPTGRASEIEAQRGAMKQLGIEFVAWDADRLSELLRDQPKLVDDFFGRSWVRWFFGDEVADELRPRLDSDQVKRFRREFAVLYRYVFSAHDPGLPIIPLSGTTPLSLEKRFVIPDVYDRRAMNLIPVRSEHRVDREVEEREGSIRDEATTDPSRVTHDYHFIPAEAKPRVGVVDWVVAEDRSVIVGAPGSGKSALLRYLATDLLSEEPLISSWAERWGDYLPVWIPFALWTREFSNAGGATPSLTEVMHTWLKAFDEERLIPLVDTALEDERLLLLVDGVDEWTNEEAARIAIDILKVFVERRNIPVVITARPSGYRLLATQVAGWQVADLCELSPEQQRELAVLWFSHWLTASAIQGDVASPRHTASQTADFIHDLQQSPDLRQLSSTPLLFCALIALRLQNASLPETRFRAYGQLIDLLISSHPARRRKAAFVSNTPEALSVDDIVRVMAQLAYTMQTQGYTNQIAADAAKADIEEYLEDETAGFGLNHSEARGIARELIDLGEGASGLLVRTSPHEIGFFHRAFQEYLASRYLGVLTLEQQLAVVSERCAEPQWREVLLSLFQHTNRSADVGQFVGAIRARSCSVSERFAVDALLAEVAFGNNNLSATVAREQADSIFARVEEEPWHPFRNHLVTSAMGGLHIPRVKSSVRARLREWFPRRVPFLSSVFHSMGRWTADADVITTLLRAIMEGEEGDARSAGRVLARICEGDMDTSTRLATLARRPIGGFNRAVALESLLIGWPSDAALPELIDRAADSPDPNLRLVGLMGLVKQGRQSRQDRERAVELGTWPGGVSFHYKEEVASVLIGGWAGSPETKAICLARVRWPHTSAPSNDFDLELAQRVLLLGYGGDPDVEAFCLSELNDRFPFSGAGLDAWRWMLHSFKDNPKLVGAIDAWVPAQEHHEPEVAIASLVGRTSTCKAKLLNILDRWIPHWPTEALLEGWGMGDDEVSGRLRAIAFGPIPSASRIAQFLPQIIGDSTECRMRLLELLRDPECEYPNLVLAAFNELGSSDGDTEIIDAAMRFVGGTPKGWMAEEGVRQRLITDHPTDVRVRELAQRELERRDGLVCAVAWSYGDDQELRSVVLERVRPLPVTLRMTVTRHLQYESTDSAFAAELLARYDDDPNDQVKTQACIAYHERLGAEGAGVDAALQRLSEDMKAVGFDFESRRRAAFAGLMTLHRGDLVCKAAETSQGILPRPSSLISSLHPNMPIMRCVLTHWSELKVLFGEEFSERLSVMAADSDTWDQLSILADEYTSARSDLLELIEQSNVLLKANLLRFLSRVRPRTRVLMERCLQWLHLSGHGGEANEEVAVAAEILGTHFCGSEEVLQRISVTLEGPFLNEGVLIALCEGWPDSDELERMASRVRQRQERLTYYAGSALLSRMGDVDRLLDLIDDLFDGVATSRQLNPTVLIRPVIRRLRSDDDLAARLSARLVDNPTAHEKASIPRLLAAARSLSADQRQWSIDELARQLRPRVFSDIGIDVLQGRLRPVPACLMDVL